MSGSCQLGPTDMNDTSGLARRIRLGEDSTLELKRVLLAGSRVTAPKRSDIANELASMANSAGGTVVLGVDDKSHEVLGIPINQLDSVERWLYEICNDSIKPALDADIRKFELPDVAENLVALIRVDIGRSLYVHKSPGGYFQRIGSSSREMPTARLARLLQVRTQSQVVGFDESIVPGTQPEDLDTELASRFYGLDADTGAKPLEKLRIISADGDGAMRMTVAGTLMCTTNPQRWLPHAQIQAVSYVGERSDVNYQSDARDIDGSLDAQVAEAMAFLQRNMRVAATKITARSETTQFSERAAFEAIVNAVAHRDYSMAGAQIRFHIFGDRIELYVPGDLANTLTVDSLHVRQYSRNQLIVSLLARCPTNVVKNGVRTNLMDRRGDGLPIIRNEVKRISGRLPHYSLTDQSELRLVMWAASPT